MAGLFKAGNIYLPKAKVSSNSNTGRRSKFYDIKSQYLRLPRSDPCLASNTIKLEQTRKHPRIYNIPFRYLSFFR